MVFSTNQARQFYVANANTSDVLGGIQVKSTKDGKSIYFTHKGHGGLTRSDLIDVDKIHSIKYVRAEAMERHLKKTTITLDGDVNEGKPVVGQDYIVTITFRNYFGPSDTHTYIKQAVARAFTETPSDLYKSLASSLAKNFARDIVKPVKVYVSSIADENLVTATTKKADIPEATSVIIVEEEQPWTLGIEEQTPVNYEVTFAPIVVDSNERIWGKAEKGEVADQVIKNGKKVADMEYFYMKERADQYGNIGWPNVVPTKYLVDPKLAYDMLEIHYSYVGANEGVQKSEKDITIVGSTSTLEIVASTLQGIVDNDILMIDTDGKLTAYAAMP